LTRRIDPRVIRTRQMLRDALVTTILEKGYDGVSIQDITDRAGLRRATFYLHYRDKDELLLTMLRETLDELMHYMETPSREFLTQATECSAQLRIFKHVQEQADLYRAVLGGQRAGVITSRLREYIASRIQEKYSADDREANLSFPVDALANYLAAVKLNMIIWWLEKDMPYTPEQMADMCTRLVLHGTGDSVLAASAVQL